MKKNSNVIKPAIISLLIFTLICGIIYPIIVTGIAQLAFPKKANGSIITVTLKDGTKKEYGSALIEQEFTKAEYLIGRPLGVSNLSPVSEEQKQLVKKRIDWWHTFDSENKADIPLDLVTTSGSGIDPHISREAADYQVSRIAKVRNISEDTIKNIINKYTSKRLFGIWGEPAVNVLKVNLALDGLL